MTHTPKKDLSALPQTTRPEPCARVRQTTGETRWFHETILRGCFPDSNILPLLLSDRTGEVPAQEQPAQALSIAKSANEGKKTFLTKMPHNIRTPMNAIIGFTQLEQTSRKFSRLRFEIADNGIGMSPQFLAQIFEPFVREKNTTLSGVAGTGLWKFSKPTCFGFSKKGARKSAARCAPRRDKTGIRRIPKRLGPFCFAVGQKNSSGKG
ncbi:MAG: hypothetical protein IJC43_06030 [Clostridia bacterium]|nr:hypothetical protein [Clostridia bacterium]